MHVSQHQPSTGPEPEGGPGGRRSLYVPVRRGPAGAVVRLWRTPVGTRTAVAFTSDRLLRSVLGPTQPWIRLSEAALRRMAEPLGAVHLTVDPLLTARPPAEWSGPAPDADAARDAAQAVEAGTEAVGDVTDAGDADPGVPAVAGPSAVGGTPSGPATDAGPATLADGPLRDVLPAPEPGADLGEESARPETASGE